MLYLVGRKATLRGALAESLRGIKDAEKLSNKRLGERVGMSSGMVNNILHASSAATIDIVDRIASAFRKHPVALLMPKGSDPRLHQVLREWVNMSEEARDTVDVIVKRDMERREERQRKTC